MIGYVGRRLLVLPLVVIAVYTLTFLLSRAAPGGPWSLDLPVPAAVLANLRQYYHADESLLDQYMRMGQNVLFHLDFGPSYLTSRREVSTMLAEAVPVSLQLGAASVVVAVLIGVPVGVLAAIRQKTPYDYAAMAAVTFGVSVPPYVTTPVMVLVFAVTLGWLPSQGWNGILSTSAIIPVVALALGPAANLARYTRNSVLDVIRLDYVRTAEAKGLAARTVLRDHILRNALLPIITVSGYYVARVLTYAFYVEYIYGIPGMGRLGVDAIFGRDYPVIVGVALTVAVLVAVTNLVVDVLYAFADPRIRYD